ncbi:ADP-ribosylglycohydrolase [Serendipita vermifera]|nr:ADP-ribosylglycohydrolase [Serendipita vermifera]
MSLTPEVRSPHDRIRGCIVGGALGDAIGLFTEFMDSDQTQRYYNPSLRFTLRPPAKPGFQTTILDYHRAQFKQAGWTDDTDQSLLILMSFLHNGGPAHRIDPLDFAKRLRYWTEYGFWPLGTPCTDVGNTVSSVVRSANFLNDPLGCAKSVWNKAGRVMAANGAVMRTPVIGALFFNDEETLYDSAISTAAVTHADPRCLASCTIVSALVAAIIRNEVTSEDDIQRIVDAAIQPIQKREISLSQAYITELKDIIWKNSLKEMKLDERGLKSLSRKIGYTYKTLASGIWALRQGVRAIQEGKLNELPRVFENAISDLTWAGGDSDTNGAVAGSLLGALVGYSNLPSQWKTDLSDVEWLLSKADAATFLILRQGPPYNWKEDPDNLFDGEKSKATASQ